MKGFLLDQNLPSRLTFKPALPVSEKIKPEQRGSRQGAKDAKTERQSSAGTRKACRMPRRRQGWRVLRIWEHELVRRNAGRLRRRLQRAVMLVAELKSQVPNAKSQGSRTKSDEPESPAQRPYSKEERQDSW